MKGKVIWKFEIGLTTPGFFDLRMPEGAQILTVRNQVIPDERETTVVYAMVRPYAELVPFRFYLAWTGIELPDACSVMPYVGTYSQPGRGALVYHLFGGITPESVTV